MTLYVHEPKKHRVCIKMCKIYNKLPHKTLDSADVCGAGTRHEPIRTSAWETMPGSTQQSFIRGRAGAPHRDDLTPSHIR